MDSSISWKAKGLLTYAFSRPEDWQFYKKEMMQHASDGEHSFDSGIAELEKTGYLHRIRLKDELGKFKGWEWHFCEEPVSEEEFKKRYRKGGFPDIGEIPRSEKPGPTKKDSYTKHEEDDERGDVVVPSFLKNLGLRQSDQTKFARLHAKEPARVEKAAKYLRGYKNPSKPGAILQQAYDEQWEPTQEPEDRSSQNRSWAQSNFKDGDVIGPYNVAVARNALEFNHPSGARHFEYANSSFRELVTQLIERADPQKRPVGAERATGLVGRR